MQKNQGLNLYPSNISIISKYVENMEITFINEVELWFLDGLFPDCHAHPTCILLWKSDFYDIEDI